MLLDNLTTNRLIFKRFKETDIPALAPFFADAEAMYYYLAEPFRVFTEDDLHEYLADWDDGETCFLYTVRLDDQPVGLFSIEDYIADFHHAELGFAVIDPKLRGKGIASEMIGSAVDHLFRYHQFKRIMMRHIEGNSASEHLIKKHGFILEGTLRDYVLRDTDTWLDVMLYGLTDYDYKQGDLL